MREVLFFLGTWATGMMVGPPIFSWMWDNPGSIVLIIGCWLFGGIILGMASLGALLK